MKCLFSFICWLKAHWSSWLCNLIHYEMTNCKIFQIAHQFEASQMEENGVKRKRKWKKKLLCSTSSTPNVWAVEKLFFAISFIVDGLFQKYQNVALNHIPDNSTIRHMFRLFQTFREKNGEKIESIKIAIWFMFAVISSVLNSMGIPKLSRWSNLTVSFGFFLLIFV